MIAELFIRAGRNDHKVIEHFLIPAASGMATMRTQPISAVVADAQVAVAQPALARIAMDAGVPFVVDPLTPLLQSVQPSNDSWARLSFGRPDALRPIDLTPSVMEALIEAVFAEQIANDATYLIPPYFYSNKRDDGWMQANLAIHRRAAHYLSKHNIKLPVIAVFAANLKEYGSPKAWRDGLDPFLAIAMEMGAYRVGLSWSWSNASGSKDAALSLLLNATSHAARAQAVVSWRSGLYGLPLTVVGASGYETGIGSRESLHYVSLQADHKPKLKKSDPRGLAFMYFSQFGRSIIRRGADALLDDRRLAGSLVCNPENACCPNGAESMRNHWREHTVRERARELRDMAAMPPSVRWRLNDIASKAQRAETLARTANEVLAAHDVNLHLPVDTFGSLHRVSADMLANLNRFAA